MTPLEQARIVRAEADKIREEWASVSERISAIDSNLAPYYRKKSSLEGAIKYTHKTTVQEDYNGDERLFVVGYRRSGSEKRFGLFPELDAINIATAPERIERRRLAELERALRRRFEACRSELKRLAKRWEKETGRTL